jgi:hypothetical protein
MTAERSPITERLIPPAGGVAVRMYRQGLGDCFLLAFATNKPRQPTYVLIDCGVHGAQKHGRDNIELIVEDVIAATRGRIDTLVVTHEHIDHLSAFVSAGDKIAKYQRSSPKTSNQSNKLRIKQLWLGWTENPDDPVANSLLKSRKTAHRAIVAALHQLDAHAREGRLGARESLAAQARLQTALSFFVADPAERPVVSEADRQPRSAASESAYELLRERAGSFAYLLPGQPPLPIPGAPAARAYVLGPPREVRLLKKSSPSSGDAQETYLTTASGLLSFAAAALGADSSTAADDDVLGESDRNELCNPFGSEYRVSEKDARKSSFFQTYYGMGAPHHESGWREIDADWLFAAEQLALDLDSHTNNTSLALAFELGPIGRGPVLLFAADAQVGSWLSWSSLAWPSSPVVDVASLFARTALYKVGHHASHNATLRRDADGADYGLELMPEGLIAMIPVDAAAAARLRGWHMPAPNLYDALLRKCRNNVLRSDEAPDVNVPTQRKKTVPGCCGIQWRRSAAAKAAGDGPLYYDVFLKPTDA